MEVIKAIRFNILFLHSKKNSYADKQNAFKLYFESK